MCAIWGIILKCCLNFLKILVSEMVLKLHTYVHFSLFLEHLEREQNFCIYSILKPIFQILIYYLLTYLHRILLESEKLISRFALVVTLWCRIVKFFSPFFWCPIYYYGISLYMWWCEISSFSFLSSSDIWEMCVLRSTTKLLERENLSRKRVLLNKISFSIQL